MDLQHTSAVLLEDLIADTTYDIYVRTLCGDGGVSRWRGPLTVATGKINIPTSGMVDMYTCNAMVSYSVPSSSTYTNKSIITLYSTSPDMAFEINGSVQFSNSSSNSMLYIFDGPDTNASIIYSTNIVDNEIELDANDDKETVMSAVLKLGYDLSETDSTKVYEEFLRAAAKKRITAKELEAIVATVALQVEPTYKLINYVVNSGNIITSTAQITLEKDGNALQGISTGDGPIDAAFHAVEQIIGSHYELDDFQIQSITEGKGAMGGALVKLRRDGKLYSGNGISTDIIGASIKAYINAVNKIVYEEA